MKLVLASKNFGKLKELGALLEGLPFEVEAWAGELPEETGETFEENARLKANYVRDRARGLALGDDSGLEVAALGGAPGVRSARYAGVDGDAERNIEKLLSELDGASEQDRGARFRCVLCLSAPGREDTLVEGSLDGRILLARRGHGGFGYDPVFWVDSAAKSLAELQPAAKNAISHRGQAVRKLRTILAKWPC